MRPFNLEEYLANPLRKVVTRDGSQARIICTNAKGGYPLVALITSKLGSAEAETFVLYNDKGRIGRLDNEFDLFFADEIPDFKPYDRVLTRGHNGLPWKANLFSNFKQQGNNTIAVCLKGDYLLRDIIQFDESKVGKIE